MQRMTYFIILALFALLLATLWQMGRDRDDPRPPIPLTESEQVLAERLRGHVDQLAETIGERNLWNYPQLQATADYIEGQLRSYGYGVERQSYSVTGKQVSNLFVEIAGSERPEEILLVGAHYDSVIGTPGANDNASGVAALLELARQLVGTRPARTVRLVAFVNEEPPFFQSQSMGSLVYAQAAKERGEKIVAMVCLETIGYYRKNKKSQQFPMPLMRAFYPHTGNFLAFVTDFSSWRLLQKSLKAFRNSSNFPTEGVVAPAWVAGIDWSDHWSFWQIDVPAIMLTDTALYRYPHYHSHEDTVEKLNYPEFSRAVAGIIEMVGGMAEDRAK